MIDSQARESRNLQQTMPELDIPGLKILKEIGRGGMARVYLAMQESLQRPVAVKLLQNPDTPGFHERFLNEGRYLAALVTPIPSRSMMSASAMETTSLSWSICREAISGTEFKRV